jgi:nucleotide-binding universal stress UspA family protein
MRVLLATDGSDAAGLATTWLRALPLPADVTTRVLSVVSLAKSALDIVPVHEFRQALRAAARHVTGVAREALAGRGAVEERVVEGEPREVIVREATEWPADLVVVGARGLGAAGRFMLGSVSTAVLHGAPGAVAVVRGQARPPRRIVVAYDDSPDALHALRFVARLPLGADATVRLLAVVALPPIPPSPPETFALPWPSLADHFIEEQKAQLESALVRAETEVETVVGHIERSVVIGHPAAEILAAADEPGVDLVVVGARGLGLFGRLVLGSVSDRVVHHARCPVLVVKTKA